MTGSLETSDAEAGAVQKPGHPRVTLDDINAAISAEYTLNAWHAVEATGAPALDALGPLTICILVMQNGFTIIGKSAPADPANYDPGLGSKLAREDAVRQAWPLMGYALRQKLYEGRDVGPEPSPATTPWPDAPPSPPPAEPYPDPVVTLSVGTARVLRAILVDAGSKAEVATLDELLAPFG